MRILWWWWWRWWGGGGYACMWYRAGPESRHLLLAYKALGRNYHHHHHHHYPSHHRHHQAVHNPDINGWHIRPRWKWSAVKNCLRIVTSLRYLHCKCQLKYHSWEIVQSPHMPRCKCYCLMQIWTGSSKVAISRFLQCSIMWWYCGDIVGDSDDPIIIITICNNDDDRNDDHVTKMMNVFKRGSVGNKCGHKPRARS